MAKHVEVVCSREIKTLLLTALHAYTQAAFPSGSSDCGLVAREAMLDALKRFDAEFIDHGTTGQTTYNKRLRALFKEGVRRHYHALEAAEGRCAEAECQLLLEVVEGIAHDDSDLAAARRSDRATTADHPHGDREAPAQ